MVNGALIMPPYLPTKSTMIWNIPKTYVPGKQYHKVHMNLLY